MKKLSSKDTMSNPEDKISNVQLSTVDDGGLIDSDIELMNPEELFGDSGGDNNSNIAKELFNAKNPKIKTELTEHQIKIISRLYQKSKKYYEPRGTFLLKETLSEFILLMISKDRKSRQEFVDTNRELQKNKDMGFMSKMFGNGNNL